MMYSLSGRRYVIQSYDAVLGWVNTKYGDDNYVILKTKEQQLLADDRLWQPGHRQTRIVDTLTLTLS